MIQLDTHVLLWLLAGESRRIPPAIRARLDRDDVAICPIVELEIADGVALAAADTTILGNCPNAVWTAA